jgi:hypothetical protein
MQLYFFGICAKFHNPNNSPTSPMTSVESPNNCHVTHPFSFSPSFLPYFLRTQTSAARPKKEKKKERKKEEEALLDY